MAHDGQSNDSDGGGSEKGIDAHGAMGTDADHVDDIHMDPTISDGDTRGVEIDDCLDPLDLDDAVPLESPQDYPEIDTGVFFDTPDPGSQADLKVESHPPSPDSDLPHANYLSSGPDVEELLDIIELEDLHLRLEFIKQICNASLEDKGMQMDEENLKHFQDPLDHKLALDDTPDICLSLKLFLANINSPVEVYNANRAAILQHHPNDDIFTHDSVKRFVKHLTGVVPLIHDMCIDTCVVYTGPYHDLEKCSQCDEPQYDPTIFETSGGKKKVTRHQFHTMPMGPQLQALYHSKESAEQM